MGITGLLPFLKDASSNVNIKQFEGCTVAVDTYCWIYRGAFSCAEQLALGTFADGHVKYVMKYVQKLLELGIKPIMVFDGSCLPSKKPTELKRRESKEMYRKKAAQCLKDGRNNEARECFQRCIECTPKMALDVIKALHQIGVDVLVAPYEADAQLAYLNKINVAQLVITEDSDLLLFGCDKVLYKLDLNGNAQLIEKEKILAITQFSSADNFDRFRWMCILSGCDYLENLPGIGLGKAKKLLKSVQKTDIEQILNMMPKCLKMPNLKITSEYVEKFIKANKTFKYQVVFDPLQRKLVSLHPYQQDILPNEDLSYAGIFYDDKVALQHSLGNLEVNTQEVFNDFDPENWSYKPPLKYQSNTPAHMRSIWSKSYVTYKNSNPFAKFLTKPQKSEETTQSINKIKRPSTQGLCKTISNSPLKTKLAEYSKSSESKQFKRKYDSIDLDKENVNVEKEKENHENAVDCSKLLSSTKETKCEKRYKTEDIKDDIDNLLNQYNSTEKENKDCSQNELELFEPKKEIPCSYESDSSPYFSSASNSQSSPILSNRTLRQTNKSSPQLQLKRNFFKT